MLTSILLIKSPKASFVRSNLVTRNIVLRSFETSDSANSSSQTAAQKRTPIARNAADLERAKREGKLAFILGLKAATIDRDLAVLRIYHGLGMRVLALCHGPSLGWVSSSREIPASGGGLDGFGREVIRAGGGCAAEQAGVGVADGGGGGGVVGVGADQREVALG